jgi:hypothetical protein
MITSPSFLSLLLRRSSLMFGMFGRQTLSIEILLARYSKDDARRTGLGLLECATTQQNIQRVRINLIGINVTRSVVLVTTSE